MEAVRVHSFSEHVFRTNSLCRLCGERVQKRKDIKQGLRLCIRHAEDIYLHFNINIHHDMEGKHSIHKAYLALSTQGKLLYCSPLFLFLVLRQSFVVYYQEKIRFKLHRRRLSLSGLTSVVCSSRRRI